MIADAMCNSGEHRRTCHATPEGLGWSMDCRRAGSGVAGLLRHPGVARPHGQTIADFLADGGKKSVKGVQNCVTFDNKTVTQKG